MLYRYLERRGILQGLMASRRFEDEARARNIVKFFSIIRSFEKVALSDRVALFLMHLDAIQDYGEDPAVAEIDSASDVVQVLTVHKAKGLEFPAVYLVQLAADRFPTRYRSHGLALPVERGGGDLSESESHREEERRLCYVALTRARDELATTYARDYGGIGARERKPSIFLLEAFDLGKPVTGRASGGACSRSWRSTGPRQARRARTARRAGDAGASRGRWRAEPLQLSFRRLEDYETCPLKYRFLHQLSVEPILTSDHRVNFGNAVHQAVAFALGRRADGATPSLDEVLEVYGRAWRKRGISLRRARAKAIRAGP